MRASPHGATALCLLLAMAAVLPEPAAAKRQKPMEMGQSTPPGKA